MARAREVEGMRCEDPFALGAALAVSVRSAEVLEHSEGVLDLEDIERLHDMRVATRRLRATMEIFERCFPKKRFRRALRDVKALADALGERRDRDVSILFLKGFADKMIAPDRRGVQLLMERLGEEQSRANEQLAPFLLKERLNELDARLQELSRAARERAGQPASVEVAGAS